MSISTAFGLAPAVIRLLHRVLDRHPEVREARIFGSRAKGNYRPESDVDLALFGDANTADANRIAAELDELPLPYHFDVQAYATIRHESLREHIDRVGERIFVQVQSGKEISSKKSSAICVAIRSQRTLSFAYGGRQRVVEPYCHGVSMRGAEVLRAVEVNASQKLGKLWLADKISQLELGPAFVADDPAYNPSDAAMREIHCRV